MLVERVAGRIRTTAADFFVEELPLYTPKGEGSHLYVQFEKTGLTTDEAVRQLAAHAGVPVRDVGVPGMKDRHAVTIQTVSIPAIMSSAAAEFDAHVRSFSSSGVRILSAIRHNNKLRTGHLRGNRFRLVVRDVPQESFPHIEAAFRAIGETGVPNAYGNQRFGARGDNVERALSWLSGGAAPRDFKQRRFLYSALQSHIFNAVLDARLKDGSWNHARTGDVLLREDRVLAVTEDADDARGTRPGLRYCEDAATDEPAVMRGDYCPSGPMFGPDMKSPRGDVLALESAICAELLGETFDWAKTRQYGEGTRRHLRLGVEDLRVRFLPPGTDAQAPGPHAAAPTDSLARGSVEVEFVLPRGAYATTVLSNVFQLTEGTGAQQGAAPTGADNAETATALLTASRNRDD